ncbi:tetratricopeptide repeat protein [Amycolatopsis sp. MJM2582]|uniref:ATP-binding protein n=1 Tax=Amycolatopsis sp. MJM2582 TaxID=1427749 RepID=UPI000689C845|nr:tetratricopeptide repeat protein [Amycolatopsis sp. MJM2582]
MDEALLERADTVRIAVVVGSPGVGKTALAVQWASRKLVEFSDGVLYRDLRGWGPDEPASPDEVLVDWLTQLGLDPATVPVDRAGRTSVMRTALAGRSMLVVLDNARDEEQVRPLLPGSPGCPVLVTSRDTLSGLTVHHGGAMVALEPLTPDESVELLRELIGERVDRSIETTGRLAVLCGHLPLALRVVAENTRQRLFAPLSIVEEELVDELHRLDELDGPDPRSAPRTVFTWSYRQLPADVSAVFRAIGVFPGQSYDANIVAALAGLPLRTAARHLRALTRVHLVREAATGRFEMHDLIRLYAYELAQQDGEQAVRAARCRLFDYFLHTTWKADELIIPDRYRVPITGSTDVPTPFSDYDGALTWLHAECTNAVALCRLDDPAFDNERWQLAFTLRGFLFLSKRTHEWIESHQSALDATIRCGDRGGEAKTRNNLGVALSQQGHDERAVAQYESARRLFAEVGDLHGVSNSLINQSVILRRRGEFAEALRLGNEALLHHRAAGSHRYVAIALRTVAKIELRAGLLAEAEQHLVESLELCARLSRMDMDAARAHNTLGQLLLRRARLDDAERSYRAAIAAGEVCESAYEQALGWWGLGNVARARFEFTTAQEHLRFAADALEQLGSPKSADVRADLAVLHEGGQSSD